MSSDATVPPKASATTPPGRDGEFLVRMDERLDGWSDWLNPILVKETRQALKSRQFLTTFFLLLLCGWGWSLLAIAMQVNDSAPEMGRFTLTGYFYVLMVPMILIVPFSAFRSLAREREDGTHELLSITTLGAKQIITGKLGSSILQMLLYYSVLAPCIAFTYLLRGVDVLTIAMLLWYTFLASTTISALGLLLAAASRVNHWQIMLSLLLLAALVFGTFMWGVFGYGMIWEFDLDAGQPWFLYANGMANTMAICFLVLFLQGAAAQLSFASDNRSTKPRITMLIQTAIFVAWMCGFSLAINMDDVAITACVLLGIYWALMGSLLCGEVDLLSPRVRRSLPQTGLGRVLFTWFAPGGSTGYLLTVSTLATALLVIVLTYSLGDRIGSNVNTDVYPFAMLIGLYVTSYLGATRGIMRATNRWSHPGPLGSFVITVALLAFGTLLPTICQLLAWRIFGSDYTMLQAPNWAWSLTASFDSQATSSVAGTIVVMMGVSIAFLLINFMFAAKDIRQYHLPTPTRVRDDDRPQENAVDEQAPMHPLDAPE